jgi:hypothetical protein
MATPAIPVRPVDATRRLGDEVVRRYAANLSIVEQLGRGFHFQSLFYWQPVIFAKQVLTSFELEESQKYASLQGIFRDTREAIRHSPGLQEEGSFRDLSGFFADSKGLVFIDYCHTTETANGRIAAAMAADVIKLLGRPPVEPPGPEG